MSLAYRVIKNEDGIYIVKKDGSSRALRVFDNKEDAINFAKKTAKNQNAEFIDETYSNISSKTRKKKKTSKSKLKNILISVLVIAIAIIGGLFGMDYLDIDKPINTTTDNSHQHNETLEGITYDNFQIHFLELGNEYAGDSTYIKAGDTDILIDAGSRKGSAETIIEYINKYCTDGKLEYVISTHAHQDHIAGFVGNTKTSSNQTPSNYLGEKVARTGIFYYYEIDNLIDFSLSDATSTLYGDYLDSVEYAVSKGTKHYKAGDCFNETNEAKREYELADGITMNILYNYYYYNSAAKTEGGENNYSVCTLFTYKNNDIESNYLLTGDLEGEGEEKMVEYYDSSTPEKTLPHCDLFKAGHHGSKTSSNEALLSSITPDICCVCCCAGSTEYTANYNNIFPTQEFITRIAKYTDKVYVTTLFNENTKEFESMNGNIIISSNGTAVGIAASNNLTKLKDTDWFNETIYVINDEICSGKGSDDFYTSATQNAVAVTRRIWPSD